MDKSQKEKVKSVRVQCALSLKCALYFADTAREAVIFYTGLRNKKLFKCLFEYCNKKTGDMHYWKGIKQTTEFTSPREKGNIALRSLSLEQEFLLTMMRIRTGIPLQDLAFRFQISLCLVSNTTWVNFLSKEWKWIVTWSHTNIIKRNLPVIFKKYYPKCCVIIDC